MPSLSPGAIEILKEMHGKTKLRFDSVEEANAFSWRIIKTTEKDLASSGSFRLAYCVDSLQWFEDDEGAAYLGLPISSYGSGATKALHAAGVI